MTKVTDIMINKDDVGKNLYRKKTYYTLVVEQDVLAKDKDEADKKFMECGLDHSKITTGISEEKDGVETYYVDANYSDSDNTNFIGKVDYDTYNFNQSFEEAVENGDVHIDTDANEDDPHPLTTIKLTDKEESDVDVALNLEAESLRGK